jgi:hypothetical protein
MIKTFRPFRLRAAAWVGVLLTAGCGDGLFGPPDAPSCTRGAITPGDSVVSAITPASCTMFSPYEAAPVLAESWRLDARQNTAYVIRLRHVADEAGADRIRANLLAYSSNAEGDPVLASWWQGDFGSPNARGGDNQEMMLAAHAARSFSLRVEITDISDTGAYSLSVESCPIRSLPSGSDTVGLNTANGCESLTYDSRRPARVAFAGFRAAVPGLHTLSVARSAGNGTMLGRFAGPDADLTGSLPRSMAAYAPFDQVAFALQGDIAIAGRYTLMIGVHPDSTATAAVSRTYPAMTNGQERAR